MIPIVIAFTPNYLVPAATTLLSILDHTELKYKFHVICLLTEDLSKDMQRELQDLNAERLEFSFINLDGRLNDIYIDERYTVAASYRLLLPQLLPEYDKVLYIDCDVVVRNDLGRLYHETNLGDNYLAAVFEATLDFQETYVKSIGVESGYYINSGFLMMNLKQLRTDKLVPQFLEAAKVDGLQFPDQDVLNQLCKGRIIGLSPIYNSIRTFFLPQYKYDFVKRYSEAEWDKVQQIGNIHYTGSKPWQAFTVEFMEWWNVYEKLPKTIKDLNFGNYKMKMLYKLMQMPLFELIIKKSISAYRYYKYKL